MKAAPSRSFPGLEAPVARAFDDRFLSEEISAIQIDSLNQIPNVFVGLLFSSGSLRVVPDFEKPLFRGSENSSSSRHAEPFVLLLQR
jgi:hypothetical protein